MNKKEVMGYFCECISSTSAFTFANFSRSLTEVIDKLTNIKASVKLHVKMFKMSFVYESIFNFILNKKLKTKLNVEKVFETLRKNLHVLVFSICLFHDYHCFRSIS